MINRNWNAQGFSRRRVTVDSTPKPPRTPPHIIARCHPDTSPVIVRGTNTNHGGRCQGCGSPLAFWFTYQMCDGCLMGAPLRKGAL